MVTPDALKEGNGVVHQGLKALDVAAGLPVGLAMAFLVNAKHAIARLRQANARSAHEHAALHGVPYNHPIGYESRVFQSSISSLARARR